MSLQFSANLSFLFAEQDFLDRFGAAARTRIPWIGSLGACDMVNFGAPETVPARYAGRRFYAHNPQVTLMLPDTGAPRCTVFAATAVDAGAAGHEALPGST